MKKRGHFVVRGRVQGVCYRMCAREEALELGLSGWVRNRADGSVEVLAEGDEETLRAFLEWCRKGPRHAAVAEVSADYAEAAGDFRSFDIAF